MEGLEELEFDGSFRSYEYTRAANYAVQQLRTSDDISPEKIFSLLLDTIKVVSFKDHLKRYIYQKLDTTERFSEIPDSVYLEVILESWDRYMAPHSFEPTSVAFKTQVKRWLTQDRVQRSTVFLLGFGLGMDSMDVSEFLTLGLSEPDIDLDDPEELVYGYCFEHQLKYAKAKEYLNHAPVYLDHRVSMDIPFDFASEEEFLAYLTQLKENNQSGRAKKRHEAFLRLYEESREATEELYKDLTGTEKKNIVIKASHVVKSIYQDVIPVTINGNLVKMSKSMLNHCFQHKRLTRQRLDSLCKGELEPSRYDLLTLLFFVANQKNDDDSEPERCQKFLQEANDILEECGMAEYYTVNPYEAFLLICLLTEDPMETFSEVWRLSYEEE